VTPLELVPGLVTGIGSVPHTDPSAAAAFAVAATPALPAMPTQHGMIELAVEGGVTDVERAFLAAYPHGPVKAQLTGPVTLTVALDDDVRALELFHRNASALEQLLDGRPALCMIDEPSFAARGSLHASGLVLQAVEAVAPFAVTGVHCCGPADWRAIVGAGPHVLSLPVELGATLSFSAMRRHLDRGGWIAWGAVPTDRPVASSDIEELWRALAAQLDADHRLAARSIVTPACGLAHHTAEQAETVCALTRELGRRMSEK
jgi:hypothetical protein